MPRRTRWEHVGAVLADVSLQAALNYDHVVRPRVERIASQYRAHSTIRTLRTLLERVSVSEFLQIENGRKQRTFLGLVDLCSQHELNTMDDIVTWIRTPAAALALLAVEGIGNKSVDYLRMLLGEPAIPIDRHMRFLVSVADLDGCVSDYDDIRRLFELSCEALQVDVRQTEAALWHLVRAC